MNALRKIAALVVCIAIAATSLVAQTNAPDWNKVLGRIDEMGDFDNSDFSAEITVVSKRPGEDDSTIVAKYYRRDSKKQFTIKIEKPDLQKGQGYFSSDDDLWFYDPESGKFAYSSLKDSFQGSDAQNSDFSSSTLALDYTVSEYAEETLGSAKVWVATLNAKRNNVPVSKRKLWIRQDNYLVLKEEHYSVSNRLMRTIAYPKYQTVSGRFVPASMVIADNLKVGERTQITFASASVDRQDDSVFNKEFLTK